MNLNVPTELLAFSKLKMYGKKISKPSRKLGHVNIIGMNNESTDELLEKLQSLKPKTVTKPSN